MSIPKYAKYYLTDSAIDQLHKQEIWNEYLLVNKDATKLNCNNHTENYCSKQVDFTAFSAIS